MTIQLEGFRPEFIVWLRRADHTISRHNSDRIAIAPRGGEWVYFLAGIQDGWIRVTRSDRGGDEGWEFDAASLEVIEHHFTANVGGVVRSRAGLLRSVRIPFLLEELSDGASLRFLSESATGGREEVSLRGRPLGVFTFGRRRFRPAVECSNYCSVSLAELRACFLRPEAEPFGLV